MKSRKSFRYIAAGCAVYKSFEEMAARKAKRMPDTSETWALFEGCLEIEPVAPPAEVVDDNDPLVTFIGK